LSWWNSDSKDIKKYFLMGACSPGKFFARARQKNTWRKAPIEIYILMSLESLFNQNKIAT